MAIGSSTLALLFKIGVDPKDVNAAIDSIVGHNKQLRKEIEAGMEAESKAFLASQKAFEATNNSAKQLGITFNQVRVAIGQLIGGVTLVRAFREISQSIEEIGTRSKEDFGELQKQVESAGGHITELQRNIAQELVGAFDKVKGASTGFMAEVIEKSGPALIDLLKDIARWLVDLKPLAAAVGNEFADTFNRLHAMGLAILELRQRQAVTQPGIGETILEGIFPPLAAKRAMDDMKTFDESYAKFLKSVTEKTNEFVAKPATFDPEKTKKGRKDLTEAALEQAKAENALTLVKQDAAIADKQINEDQAKGLITQKEAATRRIAVLAELQKAEAAVLDARKKAVETDPTLLQRQREKQLGDIETQRAVLRTQAAEAQREENNKTIAADQKLHDAFAKHFAELKLQWLDYAEFIHDQTDAIVKDLARQAQPVPGGAGLGPIPGAPPEIPLPKVGGFFEDLTSALKNSSDEFGTWGDLVGGILGQFAQASQQAFAAFILTGKLGGQIFKQLVAQIIASVAIESAVKAIFQLAEGFAALAAGNPVAAAEHFTSAKIYGVVAAVAGAAGVAIGAAGGLGGGAAGEAAGTGGFGGASAQPTPVTINQGAGGPLGIQMQQLNALNNISNKLDTASPGDVLTRGVDQNPMIVGHGVNEAARRDGTVSREFLQISGLRPA